MARKSNVQPGVVGRPTSQYVSKKEVMELLGIKEAKALSIIRDLRKELIDQDRILPSYPDGKVPRQYFYKRCMIEG